MAGQVWLVVSLFSIVGARLAAADKLPQIAYNPDGTTKLQIIDTGIAGASLQGRLSWQTPDSSQVWIQYPVNQQGRVPWTPAQFTYSVVSDPAKRVVPGVPTFQPVQSIPQFFSFDERVHPHLQVVSHSSNQEQPSRSIRRLESRVPAQAQSIPIEAQSLPNESEYDYDYDHDYIEEALFENQPITASSDQELPQLVMNKFPGPGMDKFPGPVMDKFPGPVMDKFPGPEMDKFPGPEMDKFPGPEMDKFPGPVMDKFPGPEKDTFAQLISIDDTVLPNIQLELPRPFMDKFSGPPVMEKFPGPPVMEKFPGPPVMEKFPGPPVMEKFPGPPVMEKFPGPPVMEKFPGLPGMEKFPGPPVMMNKFPGPDMNEFHDTTTEEPTAITTESPIQTSSLRNRFTLPFTTTTSRSLPVTEARVTPLPTIFRATTRARPMINKFPAPTESRVTPFPRRFRPITERTAIDRFPSTMMNKFPGLAGSRPTPIRRRFRPTTERTIMNKFPGPIMNKFPGPFIDKFPGPTESTVVDTTEEENVSVTEPVLENIVINELDSTNVIETDEQIEETTELGPVIRLTSRGRPRLFNKPAQKIRTETKKQSSTQKPNQFTTQNQNNRPVPQLIVDTTLRQSNGVQPNTRENNDNSFRFRRPGSINQQGRPENNQLDESQPIIDPSLRQINIAQPSIRANNANSFRPRRPGVRRFRTGGRRRQGIRRIPVNVPIFPPSTDIALPDEGRGSARSPPAGLRSRN